MDNRYREELDRIRLTEESKGALAAALAARRSAPERRSRRAPLRRLAALAACVCLVLGLMNYPAIAAGAERVFRYILGVGAAETSASLLVQGEGISHGDGDFLYLIDGAYQRDGVLTVPLDVVSREESPDREAAMRYRLTVYDAEGERLPQVYRWDGELREFRGAETVRFQPLDAYSNWLAWTWLPQGYAGAASNCFLMGTEGPGGPIPLTWISTSQAGVGSALCGGAAHWSWTPPRPWRPPRPAAPLPRAPSPPWWGQTGAACPSTGS